MTVQTSARRLVKEGRVLAGMTVNVWDVVDDVQALIRSRRPVDTDRSPIRGRCSDRYCWCEEGQILTGVASFATLTSE